MSITTLHERTVGSLLFPFSQYLYNRRGIRAQYRNSAVTERMTEEELAAMQGRRLRAVVEHAGRSVPFYEGLFKQAGIRPQEIRSPDDLRHIPALSRDDIYAHRKELLDRRFLNSLEAADSSRRGPAEPIPFARFKKYSLVRNTSSGSTGAPTVFYENGSVSAMSWANELRVKRWYGIKPGLPEARLVRVSPEYVLRSKANRVRRFLWNQLMLPGVNLTEKEYDLIAGQLEQFHPRSIWAFTSAAAGLARRLEESHRSSPAWKPSLIITWAAPLYDHEREIIEAVFGCSLSNIYGLREVGHIGSTCPAGSLHVFQESHFLETDDNGELLVTLLRPSPMPFIRYRTGDIGELSVEKCACGVTLQVIKQFHGRTGEIYTTPDGRMFSPNFWCRTFMDTRLAGTVKRFQIIYTENDTIRIKLVAAEGKRPEIESLLLQTVRRNFGESMPVKFEYVGDIPPQISGKYQMVVIEPKS